MVVRPQIDRYDQYIPYPQYLKLLLRATDATTSGMKDFSGYGRTITAYGNTTGSTTKKKINSHSMAFDGTGDYLSIPDSSDWYFGTSPFTISCWFMTPSTTTEQLILSQLVTSSGTNTLQLEQTSSGDIRIQFNVGGVEKYAQTTNSPIIANTWYHIICLADNDKVLKVYVNGIIGENTASDWSSADIGAPLWIGANEYNTSGFLNGFLDELCIWKGIAIPINQLYPQNKPFSFRRA